MKSKISKILGIVLSLALLSSMAIAVAPVSAAPGVNAWDEITLPVTGINGVDELEIAPNGDMYVSSFTTSDDLPYTGSNYIWWDLYKSTDGGYTWTVTDLDYEKLGGSDSNDSDEITAIAASPDSQTIYVGTYHESGSGEVWKIEDEGAGEPYLIQQPLGNESGEYADYVYDLEVWSDGVDNWLLAACDIDVLVLKDSLFELWRDMEVSNSFDDSGEEGDLSYAFKASFDPEFETSFLLWALISVYQSGTGDDEYILTTTGANSPGQWGSVIEDSDFSGYTSMNDDADYRADFAFASNHTPAAPIIYAALNDGSGYTTGDGNLFLVEFAYVATPATTQWTALLSDRAMSSVEVSGGVILAGALRDNIVFRSINEGDTFAQVTKAPTGGGEVNVYMTDGFDAENGVGFALTRRWAYDESAISKTIDGGDTWNQIAFIDTTIDEILDMTWSPDFPGGSFMLLLTRSYGSHADTISLWRTENALDAKPTWERVLCADDSSFSYANFFMDEDEGHHTSVEWSQDGNTVMLQGDNGNEVIFKSGNNAQTFTFWRTLPSGMDIHDWVVLDGVTLYAATDEGFYGKSAYGPPTHVDTFSDKLNSIALQPGFDASDPANSTIIVGTEDGNIYVSLTAGDTWGVANNVGSGDVYVAFDSWTPGMIYYATSGSTVGTATISGNKLKATSIEDLEDSLDPAMVASSDTGFSGLVVSPERDAANPGNVIYAMADGIGGDAEVIAVPDGVIVTVTGTIQIQGDDNGGTGALDLADNTVTPTITVLAGTFLTDGTDDGTSGSATEALFIIGDDLTFNGTHIVGTIMVEGSESMAIGTIAISVAIGDVTVTGLVVSGETLTPTSSILIYNYASDGGGTMGSDAVDAIDGKMWRMLLQEEDNEWEVAPIDGAEGLWRTNGSNTLWTVVSGDELWALEDTCNGPVMGLTVDDVTETTADISWNALLGADNYEYKWWNDDVERDFTGDDDTEATLSGLSDNEDFTVMVRVPAGFPFQSRWSAEVDFTTVEAIATPVNQVPDNGMQNAPILPSFGWEAVDNAVSYEFELGTAPDFAGATKVTTTAVFLTWQTELAYDTNHYWRVRAVSATGTISDWCASNFHTMLEPTDPIIIEPAPTPTIILPTPTVIVEVPEITLPDITVVPPDVTVNLPTPTITTVTSVIEMPEEVTPVYIWAIVAIGGVLTIAVIVLIIRTRRVV